jgi:hypothetical protein
VTAGLRVVSCTCLSDGDGLPQLSTGALLCCQSLLAVRRTVQSIFIINSTLVRLFCHRTLSDVCVFSFSFQFGKRTTTLETRTHTLTGTSCIAVCHGQTWCFFLFYLFLLFDHKNGFVTAPPRGMDRHPKETSQWRYRLALYQPNTDRQLVSSTRSGCASLGTFLPFALSRLTPPRFAFGEDARSLPPQPPPQQQQQQPAAI